MAVVVIDTIKPKNNGTFPVVEAVDVKVTNDKRLDAALNDKANQSDVTALQTAVAGKASQADLTALSTTVAGKQNALSTAQLTAVNSGINSELVTQIGTNTTAIAGKANASDVATADANLQAQIDNLITPVTQDAEVQNARVGADGTSYQTLKERLDTETTSIINDIDSTNYNLNSISAKSKTGHYVSVVDGASESKIQNMLLTIPYSASSKTNAEVNRFGKNWITITGTTQTINGVTFTVNDDGTILVNGTATADTDFIIDDLAHKEMYPAETDFVLSGSPINGDTSKYRFRCYVNYHNYDDLGEGVIIPNLTVGGTTKVSIVVYSGTTMNNVLFKPMLSLASQYDGIYESPKYSRYRVNFNSISSPFYGGTVDFITGDVTSLYDSNGTLLPTPVVYHGTVVATGTTLPIKLYSGYTNFIGALEIWIAKGTLNTTYSISIKDVSDRLNVTSQKVDNIESGQIQTDNNITHIYNGDYTSILKKTDGVPLANYTVGDVVDLSNLNAEGNHYTALISELTEKETFYINITDGTSSRPWAFLDHDYHLISMSEGATATKTELTVPTNAKYLLIQCGEMHYSNAKVIRYHSLNEYDKNISINFMNTYSEMIQKLENASNVDKNDTSVAVKNRDNLLNLIHFSDVHGNVQNIRRILEFSDLYNKYISDVIHTGDAPATYYGDNNPFSSVGGNKILEVVGNHECWIEGDSWPSPYNATEQQVYSKFFAPFITAWNVESAGENLCYYYKDYSIAKVRLIVLDAIHYNNAQQSWFESTLSNAILNEMRVVAVTHYPAQTGITGINCAFNCLTRTINPLPTPEAGTQFERMPESAFEAIDTFINNGGEFVCWLSGHTHEDFIGTVNDHANQIQIIISCADTSNKYSDCARTQFTQNQDLFNVFTVDGNAKLIKLIRVGSTIDKFLRKREVLCINYDTKEVIS